MFRPLSHKLFLYRESDTRFSALIFFHNSVFPGPLSIPQTISNFFENSRRYANECLSAVLTTPAIKEKNFEIQELSWVHFTSKDRTFVYFSFSPPINCSPVSTTPPPPINCLPVSTTPSINFSSAINCIDDRGLFFLHIGTNRWYLQPPKSDTADWCHWNRHEKLHP